MPGYLAAITCPLFFAVILVCSCGFLVRDPVISVKNVAVASLSLTNPVGITLKTLAFDVYYQKGADWTYLSSVTQSDVVIKSGKNDLAIPVNIRNTELFSALFGMIADSKLTLQVKGFASPDLCVCAPKIPFTYTSTIPLALPGR
jgi:hypothetical protein